MGKLERIAKIGIWPRCLGAELAAIYCGVSRTHFYRKVDDGTYPSGFENGGLVQWDRLELDEAIEALKQNRETASHDDHRPDQTGDQIGKALEEWTPGNSAVS